MLSDTVNERIARRRLAQQQATPPAELLRGRQSLQDAVQTAQAAPLPPAVMAATGGSAMTGRTNRRAVRPATTSTTTTQPGSSWGGGGRRSRTPGPAAPESWRESCVGESSFLAPSSSAWQRPDEASLETQRWIIRRLRKILFTADQRRGPRFMRDAAKADDTTARDMMVEADDECIAQSALWSSLHGRDSKHAPGTKVPTLLHTALAAFARDWSTLAAEEELNLPHLPLHLKTRLIRYLGRLEYPRQAPPATISKACWTMDEEGGQNGCLQENPFFTQMQTLDLLFPSSSSSPSLPTGFSDRKDQELTHAAHWETESSQVTALDFTGWLSKGFTLRRLSRWLLTGPQAEAAAAAAAAADAATLPPSVTPARFPYLTHLSLGRPLSGSAVSWPALAQLSGRLSTLTHLSLARWPMPVGSDLRRDVSDGELRAHLSHDSISWSRSASYFRRLSNNLYCLRWLDLGGCVEWAPAVLSWWQVALQPEWLRSSSSFGMADDEADADPAHGGIDWTRAWKQLQCVRLGYDDALIDHLASLIVRASRCLDAGGASESPQMRQQAWLQAMLGCSGTLLTGELRHFVTSTDADVNNIHAQAGMRIHDAASVINYQRKTAGIPAVDFDMSYFPTLIM